MPDNIIRYKLLISCPGDVQKEIEIIEKCVKRFNETFEDYEGISIKPIHWSKDSYPESGAKPQEILNKQIVKDCDAVVAIFWTRFGTPTDKYGSGTEEEIEIMLQNHKQVFLYFSDVPCSPSDMQHEGYKKIQVLKSRFEDRGYYKTYKTYKEFEETFYANLTRYFLTKQKVEQISRVKPQLVLRGIVGTQVTEKARLEPMALAFLNYERHEENIQKLFSKINNYKIVLSPTIQVKKSLYTVNNNPLCKVTFTERGKDIVTKYVKEVLDKKLDENFFDLGNLCKRQKSISIPELGNTNETFGSPEEIQKRDFLYEMYDLICERNFLKHISEYYKGHPGIRLAVENIGTSFDEDIQITLKFPKGTIVPLNHLIIPADDSLLEFIIKNIDVLYGIPKTANYEEYPFRYSYLAPMSVPMMNNNHHKELVNIYSSKLEYLFHYEFFQEDNDDIIQIEYQSVNHNFAVAFPSILFLSRTIDSIDYTIRSKHNPDIVKGALAIEIDESLKTKEIQDL